MSTRLLGAVTLACGGWVLCLAACGGGFAPTELYAFPGQQPTVAHDPPPATQPTPPPAPAPSAEEQERFARLFIAPEEGPAGMIGATTPAVQVNNVGLLGGSRVWMRVDASAPADLFSQLLQTHASEDMAHAWTREGVGIITGGLNERFDLTAVGEDCRVFSGIGKSDEGKDVPTSMYVFRIKSVVVVVLFLDETAGVRAIPDPVLLTPVAQRIHAHLARELGT